MTYLDFDGGCQRSGLIVHVNVDERDSVQKSPVRVAREAYQYGWD